MKAKTIVRFTPSERWFHNSVMFTFVLLLITGMVMLYFNLAGEQGEPRKFLVLIHEVFAVFFLVIPTAAFLLGDKKIWRENLGVMTRWGKNDFIWLAKKPLSAMITSIDLPDDDKFNPGQKVWAMLAISGTFLLIVTGIIMWAMESPILAIFVHTAVAIILAIALSGHIYMAVVNKETREGLNSIIDGEVDLEWARHHHPLWIERHSIERVAQRLKEEPIYANFQGEGDLFKIAEDTPLPATE